MSDHHPRCPNNKQEGRVSCMCVPARTPEQFAGRDVERGRDAALRAHGEVDAGGGGGADGALGEAMNDDSLDLVCKGK